MKRHLISLVFVALPFAISGTARAQQAITPDQLVGAWKLQSQVFHNAATTGNDTVGPLAIGYLTFVREGNNLRASGYDSAVVQAAFLRCAVDAQVRAEAVSLEAMACLFRALNT